MKKISFILMAVGLYSMALFAAPVSRQQASEIAARFLADKYVSHRALSASQMQVKTVLDKVDGMGIPYLYAVQAPSGSGYVIVSGDDRAPAVLGYTERGSYDESQMPENMRSWLQHYVDELTFLQQHGLSSPQLDNLSNLGDPIAKTTTSLWDQAAPYNAECPMVTTYADPGCTTVYREPTRAVTGCAATALAQVLYVWRDEYAKPETTEGKLVKDIPARIDVVTQASERNGDQVTPVWTKFSDEVIPASTAIDWGNLIDEYSKRDENGKIVPGDENVMGTPEQQAAVARLMHICGSIADMSYGTTYAGGSGTLPYAPLKGAGIYLNFPNARYQQQAMYSYEEWIQRLYDELKVARAVSFGGSSSGGGHAFVIDGYDKEDLFHVNWGWSGVANEAAADGGFYRINSLLPTDQGIGGSVVNDGFKLQQSFYTGLYPHAPAPAEPVTLMLGMLGTYQTQVEVKDEKLKLHLFSATSNQKSPVIVAQLGCCLENEAGVKKYAVYDQELTEKYLADVQSKDTVLTWTGVKDGNYEIRMCYRTTLADDAWTFCDYADNAVVKVVVSNGQATVRNSGLFEFDLVGHNLKDKYAANEDVSATLNYKVSSGSVNSLLLVSVAVPVKAGEEGTYVYDNDRKQVSSTAPFALYSANEGEEFSVLASFPAAKLETGVYRLNCMGLALIMPGELYFEVTDQESTGVSGPVVDSGEQLSSVHDNAWTDLQGRKLGTQPTKPGIYITNGRKVVVR